MAGVLATRNVGQKGLLAQESHKAPLGFKTAITSKEKVWSSKIYMYINDQHITVAT